MHRLRRALHYHLLGIGISVRLPCPIHGAMSDYRVQLLEARWRNLLCVVLMVSISTHCYAMDIGFFFF